jgi:hypothetical protein
MQKHEERRSLVEAPESPSWLWPHGRRLSDKILQVFRYACVMHRHEDAKMLLDVCEEVEARRAIRFGGDRRHRRSAHAARQWFDLVTSKGLGPSKRG